MRKKLFFIAFLMFFTYFVQNSMKSADASTYNTVQRSGFLAQGMKLNYGIQTLVGQIWADSGQSIVSFNFQYFGATKNSAGNGYASGSASAYGPFGYMEFKIVDDKGNVVYDNRYSVSSNGYQLRETGVNVGTINLPAPANRLDFYITNGVYENFWSWSQPYYYTLYPETYYDDYYTNINFNVITITEGDQVALQTLSAAQGAEKAAQNTVTYAQNAQTAAQAAQAAANQVNTIVNNTLTTSAGVVQDSSGTVLTAARAAQAAANQANTGISDLSNKIDSNQQALSNQLSDLKNSVTNNFNNLSQFLTPSLKKISGVNGATATSGSSIRVVLDYSNATDYRYSVDGGAWSTWSPLSGNQISVPLGSPGAHTITVQVRNGNSDTAPTDQASMSVFKL